MLMPSRRGLLIGVSATAAESLLGPMRRASAAQFSGGPAGWNIELSDDEVQRVASGAAAAAPVVPAPYNGYLIAGAGYLAAINQLGGNKGVNITGSGAAYIVTPRGVPLVGDVFKIVVNIGKGAFKVAADLAREIGGKTPWGSKKGEIHVDEGRIGHQERFTMVALGKTKKIGSKKVALVAILSHRGYFCADHDRGGRVWADRLGLATWETWGYHNNSDGTASFSSDQNWFMHANTGNKEVWTNSPGIKDDRDKFYVELLGNGQIALKSKAINKYLSVAG